MPPETRQIALVGLGRMGRGIAARLLRAGFVVRGFDPDRETSQAAASEGVQTFSTLSDLIAATPEPRRLWIMVPSGTPTEAVLDELKTLLSAGDAVVEGGNSYYKDSMARAGRFRALGIGYLDVGTSGGILGADAGYSMTIGGSEADVATWRVVFEALAPLPTEGWAHVGDAGAGHFAKMIHNGIEYGMMQAMAEGMALLRAPGEPRVDAAAATAAWRRGSIIASALIDLVADISSDPDRLQRAGTQVADSGEGRWTVLTALEREVSAPIITQALMERFRSRDPDRTADRLLATLRGAFGGHAVPTGEKP